MDFFSDLSRIASTRLTQAGYYPDPAATPEDIIRMYLNATKRRISKRPRKVLIAAEFRQPSDELLPAFNEILRKAKAGEDLVPHQSRKVIKLDYNDALLNDWDIHHLHLSLDPHPSKPRLMKGTKQLLFVRVTSEAFYCIEVLGHKMFSEKRLLETVHRNWPETLIPLRGVFSEQEMTSEDIHNLRVNGVNVAVRMDDGTVYTSVGGGCVTTGLNMLVVIHTDKLRAMCNRLEGEVQGRLAMSRQALSSASAFRNMAYHFQLLENDGKFEARDIASGVWLGLSPPPIPEL